MTIDTAELIAHASAAGITIATAESCTGGMIAAALTEVPGSSAVVDCGFVTYSNTAKMRMLGVRAETLEAHGAVSEQVAAEMAAGALAHAGVTLAVSVTGIAGPGGSEFKPEGRVCFGLCRAGQPPVTETLEFGAIGRANVRSATREHALALLRQAIS
ncbi:nicotinamide-nucleotide amidohydrolase family protein [Leisingera sp.]|uniref:CinA family protein n=1 Tax=Leisingera sp. TaxID=1879318 RepID=UPI002B2728D2|nr:nicotinamide-nucleotide amidohydrolase family protein [Leisingera sp.]